MRKGERVRWEGWRCETMERVKKEKETPKYMKREGVRDKRERGGERAR